MNNIFEGLNPMTIGSLVWSLCWSHISYWESVEAILQTERRTEERTRVSTFPSRECPSDPTSSQYPSPPKIPLPPKKTELGAKPLRVYEL